MQFINNVIGCMFQHTSVCVWRSEKGGEGGRGGTRVYLNYRLSPKTKNRNLPWVLMLLPPMKSQIVMLVQSR